MLSTNTNKKEILYGHESQDPLWVHLSPPPLQKVIPTYKPKLFSTEF